jgi:hypothetical protein
MKFIPYPPMPSGRWKSFNGCMSVGEYCALLKTSLTACPTSGRWKRNG